LDAETASANHRAPGRQGGRMSSKRGAVSGPSPHHPKSLP